jgi:H+/Cl- antiporter ClcA
MLPGVLLAAFAAVALGWVLGPEAPLLALGSGLGVLALRLVRRDAPQRSMAVMAAAGSFAAIATIFGSPVVGALIIIEAAGLGGPTLPLLLLPGLLSAGIGSLVFIGMGSLTGLSTAAYAITPLSLSAYSHPGAGAFAWTVLLAATAALVVHLCLRLGRAAKRVVVTWPFFVVPAAGLVVAALAILFFEITKQPASLVLFSGQETMGPLVEQAATLSLGTLALLIVLKGLAWGVSLGAARGGPTFPAIFLGVTGGLLAAHLPGFSETPAIAVSIGAACVSVLRLPLSCVVLALIVSGADLGASPLVVVGVVVAYLVTLVLTAREAPPAQPVAQGSPMGADPARGA